MSIVSLVRDGMTAARHGIDGVSASARAVGGDLLPTVRAHPLDERDPDFIRRTLPLYQAIVDAYFRSDVRGLELIPDEGPVLLVGNHSGGTYIADTFAFAYAFTSHFGPNRPFHQLVHDVAAKLPGLSAFLRKYGGVPASHEHARRAFKRGAAVLVYPGGDYETFRPTTHSENIEFGGRKGFVRLAISEGVPIVPVVAIGGQETALFLTRGQRLARLIRLDRIARIKVLPIQLAPPFGVTLLDLPVRIPLPAQITVQVLPKIDLKERFGADPDEDEVYEAVTAEMQRALDKLAEERDLPLVGRVWSEPAKDVVPRSTRRRSSKRAASSAGSRNGRRTSGASGGRSGTTRTKRTNGRPSSGTSGSRSSGTSGRRSANARARSSSGRANSSRARAKSSNGRASSGSSGTKRGSARQKRAASSQGRSGSRTRKRS